MKKIIIAAVVAVVAIAGITAVVLSHKKNTDKKATSTTAQTSTNGSSTSTGSNNSTDNMSNMNSGNSNSSSNNSSSSSSAASPVATDKVTIADFAYTPASITVKKGTSVTWTNEDSAQHTVTIDDGTGPHSQPLNKGDTYTYTFSDAGTYKYHCTFHSNMTGTVTVTE
ncbi:MAG TPA: cupredoxin domain-containing protein [Bacillota bacterium]|nr:cupredoxin domain-containing protein [Bacillota bacterium]